MKLYDMKGLPDGEKEKNLIFFSSRHSEKDFLFPCHGWEKWL